MANKTIPQLPLQTGITDNDLLAIVDSGETTTSRIKVSTLLSSAGGGAFQTGDATDSIVPAYSPTSRGVVANTTYVDKLNVNLTNALDIDNGVNNSSVTIGGYGTRTISGAGLGSAFVGGRNAQISGNANFAAGQFGSSIAGENNGMVAGRGNIISGGEFSFIGGGRSCSTSNFYSGILAGQNNTNNGQWSTILGGQSNSTAGDHAVVLGGRDNFANGKDALVMSSEFAEAKNSTTVIGGWGTYAYGQSGSGTNPDKGSIIIYSNNTFVRQTNGSGTANIVGGLHGIMLSSNSEINGQSGNESNKAVIIGSESSQITGGTDSTIMLGCSGRTGVSSYTTYVETLEAFDGIVLNDYANLNFASDSAAATGGVPLGGMYHNSGDMKIRIT